MEQETLPPQARLDEAMFALPEEGLKSIGSGLGRARLRTFIGLRWIAVVGQTIAVLAVYFILRFDLNLGLCLAIIAASAWFNIGLTFAFRTQRLTNAMEATAQLAFDTAQLAALIGATGGLSNPFLLLLIAPVSIGTIRVRRRHTIGLAIFALALAGAMPFYAAPLPWIPGEALGLPLLYQWGQFAALTVGLTFFAISAVRINQDETRLVRALDAAQIVMAREQRLSALGAMAAMTAHELGTPLATIHLVSKEMAAGLEDTDPLHEDATLLVEQAERCRNILKMLAEQREAGDIVHARMPISALVEEASAPHKGLGVAVHVRARATQGGEDRLPILARSPEIIHALGAFIENAVSFAETEVHIEASWSAEQYTVTIRDDGPGFSADVLPKLGEPYVSERGAAQAGGGDMGLGFFIAKTLVERTGGRIAMQNRTPPARGAVVQASWPRKALEPKPEHPI